MTVVTDPFNPDMVGLSYARQTADVVTISHEHGDHNNSEVVKNDKGEVKVLKGPGEYEIKNVNFKGVATWHDKSQGSERGKNTVFVIEMDNIKIAHLGDLGHKLTEDQLSQIGDIDILLIPVGGFYTIDAPLSCEIVSQIEPKVIIPMHYQVPGLKEEVFAKLADVSEFVKAIGMTPKNLPSYQVKQEGLPQETELIILERKS